MRVIRSTLVTFAVLAIAATAPAVAGGTATHTSGTNLHTSTGGSLHTGTGGTGISAGSGSGGTGLSAHGSAGGNYKGIGAKTPTATSSAASNTQQQMVPAKPFTPPKAGVRPQTDLAKATKLIGLSSAGLVKHSQLFGKGATPAGDPSLSAPVLNAIGPTTGGSASFKAVAGITAAESNANIYPGHQRGAAAGKPSPSLWGGSGSTATATSGAADEAGAEGAPANGGGWLLRWLTNLLTGATLAALSWYAWKNMPSGARMTRPVPVPS